MTKDLIHAGVLTVIAMCAIYAARFQLAAFFGGKRSAGIVIYQLAATVICLLVGLALSLLLLHGRI
jgi:hypothetical protein